MRFHDHVTIRVDLGEGPPTGETLWAISRGGDAYEIRNAPFFSGHLNWGDVVRCRENDEGELQVEQVLERSGHRTLRVLFDRDVYDSDERDEVLDSLAALGVGYEHGIARLYAVDVPPEVDYDDVSAFLDERHERGLLRWELSAESRALAPRTRAEVD